MPKKDQDGVSQARPTVPVSLLAFAVIMVGLLMIYVYTQPSEVEEEMPADFSPAIPIELGDPAALEQNGQPLVNDGSAPGTQPFQNTQPINQSSESNLQGSPSTQSTAPADSIPGDWLE